MNWRAVTFIPRTWLMVVLELSGKPEIVMFFRPVDIGLPGAHGFELTLHLEHAEIDVGQD
jgi:hypothetical protein